MTTSHSPESVRALPVSVALGSAGLVLTSQLYAPVPVMNELAARYAVTAPTTGWLITAFSLAYAAGFLVVAPTVLRRGYRVAALVALGLLAVATALLAVAPTFEVALGVRVLQGLAASPFIPAALSYLTTRVPTHRRAVAVAVLVAMSFSAGLVGQITARALVDALGWPGGLLVEAAMLVATAGLVAVVLPPDPAPSSSSRPKPAELFVGVVRQRALRPLLFATPALLCSFVLVYTGLQLAGPSPLRTDPDLFLALRASALPAMAAAPLVSHWLRNRQPVRRASGALLISAVGMAAAAVPLGLPGLAAGLFVAVGGIAVAAPALVSAVADRATAAGPANTVYSLALFAGAAGGSPLAAVLAPAGGQLIALVAAAALGAAAVLAVSGDPGRTKTPRFGTRRPSTSQPHTAR